MSEELQYHSERATNELNLGLTAQCVAAARSHLRLASMHLQRVKELAGSGANYRPPLTM